MTARTSVTESASVVLHAWQWPHESTTGQVRAAMAAALPGAQIVEARPSGATARSAAAVIAEAIASCDREILVVADAGLRWPTEVVVDVTNRAFASGSLVVAVSGDSDALFTSALEGRTDRDLIDVLVEDLATNGGMARTVAPDPGLWSCPRHVYDSLGGLDPELWHLGAVADLAIRARAMGVSVAEVVTQTAPGERRSWPMLDDPHALLSIRNRLIVECKALSASAADPSAREAWSGELARSAVAAIAAAWSASGVDAGQLTFGGRWGRRSWQDRLLGRSGAPPRSRFWPADERRTLMPLLALDSFIDWLVDHPPAGPLRAPDQALRIPVESGHDDGNENTHPASQAHGAVAERAWDSGDLPLVSVIVVNWNGREHLTDCFGSLGRSDYPGERLEFICVDNGSTDGSRELLATAFPHVRVVSLPRNLGFAGGNRAGVDASRGRVLLFLNNDMRVEPDTVRRLVEALSAEHPCAAARVLSWDGARVDFARGTASFEGRGFQEHYGEPNRPEFATAVETFFPNGGCFAVTRSAYDAAGGFDDSFFAYYEDVDLGWALRVLGFGITVAGNAIAYHRHGATSSRQPSHQKQFLMDRNALWTVIKRYDRLDFVLAPVLLLAVRRIAEHVRLRRQGAFARAVAPFSARFRLWRGTAAGPAGAVYGDDGGTGARRPRAIGLQRFPVERWAALGAALDHLPAVAARRRISQARRRARDPEILPHLGRPFEYARSTSSYRSAQDALVRAFGLREIVTRRSRVLFITSEPLCGAPDGARPRFLALGRALSRRVSVTIASPGRVITPDDRCAVVPYTRGDWRSLKPLVANADVVVLSPLLLHAHQTLVTTQTPLVIDLGGRSESDETTIDGATRLALSHGDFFMVKDERARDFFLGALHTLGRVNPFTYVADPTLRGFIATLPDDRVRDRDLCDRAVETLARFCVAAEVSADRAIAVRAVHARLREGYRLSKRLKRAALSVGLSETRIEQVKALKPVRLAMDLRDRLALARARAAASDRRKADPAEHDHR